MKTSSLLVLLGVASLASGCGAGDPAPIDAGLRAEKSWSDRGFKPAAPGYVWSFPRDHWAHPDYRNEWWYFTGHLEGEENPGREFGFQFTLFRIALRPEAQPYDSEWKTAGVVMGHASIVDKQSGDHRFSEVIYREGELLGQFLPFEPGESGAVGAVGEIAWVRGPAGTDESWRLDWLEPGFAFRMQDRRQQMSFGLEALPVKPLVFQGPGGFSAKEARGASGSLYYSFPRLELRGDLQMGDERLAVRGLGWMDKEFSSNHLSPEQVGWDWFSLQLNDGQDLMLFRLRREDGSQDFASGTRIDGGGQPRYLASRDLRMKPGRSWRSESTGHRYPVEWELEIPQENLLLKVRAIQDGQENRSTARGGLAYWEGAVEVFDAQGRSAGRGYLEMTGYGSKNKPPI